MKRFYKILILGAGMLSGLVPQMARSSATNVIVERQVKDDIRKPIENRQVILIGGLPVMSDRIYGTFGMTPKEYGIRYGNGASRKAKVNRNHRRHIQKLKKSRG
ncbi:hypothetical protein [Sphingobacterium hotanense]|uniref:Uncharacterized protein n=1 Tax=Sphingobacterium hotanense TaxID=649196 RepID=A0ABT7NLM4_9SPHI|nr:hypothetical protein [Sphingobacterium hotanense]MDM1048051.1 hypothetical protein [Sphingobacterium hotanense]